MIKCFSIHEIHHKPTPEGPVVVQKAGAVFELADADVKDLVRLGAIRRPTKAELQLFDLANGGTVVQTQTEAPAPEPAAEGSASEDLLG